MFGLDPYLLPLWVAISGGLPFRGMVNLMDRLQKARENSKAELLPNTFCDKVEAIQKASPEDYERYRMESSVGANVGAGSDTTSITLTALLYHMVRNKKTYIKLRNEIRSAVEKGEVSEPITFEQAQRLPYLQFVVKETLRIHPATGLPMWRVVQESGVTIADTFFPGGVSSAPDSPKVAFTDMSDRQSWASTHG